MQGKKKSFGQIVREVIYASDVVVEVIDARLLELSRSQELEDIVEKAGKRLIIVINKCDLVSKDMLDARKKDFPNAVYVSSTKKLGFNLLREMIYKVAAHNKSEQIVVGIIGYPNVGKSSIINGLKGRGSASVAARSGHTKGRQHVRVTDRIMLIDTPGVIPIEQTDPIRLALLASKNPDQLRDPDLVAEHIISLVPKPILEAFYGATTLDEIALKRGKLSRGGDADIITMGRIIVADWQRGRIQLE
jgi:ribosome biogenesis GTPase A